MGTTNFHEVPKNQDLARCFMSGLWPGIRHSSAFMRSVYHFIYLSLPVYHFLCLSPPLFISSSVYHFLFITSSVYHLLCLSLPVYHFLWLSLPLFITSSFSKTLDQCCAITLSGVMEMFCIWAAQYCSRQPEVLLSTGNVASVTEELGFKLCFILTNLNFNGHLGLVATVLESTAPGLGGH